MRTCCRMLVALLAVTVLCVGCEGKPPRGHYEKAGAFSYDPPVGWQITEFPGLKYRICHGPREADFAPNINVVDEAFPGTLAAYVEANLENMKKVFINLKILSREDVMTRDNENAVKVVTENEQQRRMLRQTFFFTGSGNRKYVITCTALADGGAKLDTVFAESLRTFRMH